MKKENLNQTFEINLSKDLFLQVSTDKAAKISALREEKDDITKKISQNEAELNELYNLLKTLKGKIKVAKATLREKQNTRWSLKRELSLQNKFAKRINTAFINGKESVDVTKFYTTDEQEMSPECEVILDKEFYLEVSRDKAQKISFLKEEKDKIVTEIRKNKEELQKLNEEVRVLKGKINLAKTTLSENKSKKWSLKRELSLQKKFARRINKAYSRGDKSVDITKFYTVEEQKTR